MDEPVIGYYDDVENEVACLDCYHLMWSQINEEVESDVTAVTPSIAANMVCAYCETSLLDKNE
jgi:hypothetical protein